MGWDSMQKEVAEQRVTARFPIYHESRLKSRDVLPDDPTLVELPHAGAISTMTRATDIEQQASEWLIRSESEHFTDAMRAELESWLQEPAHRVSFLRVEKAWRQASRLIAKRRPFDGNVDLDLLKDPAEDRGQKSNNPGSPWTFRIATTAAIALVMYFAGFAAWIAIGSTQWISYTTSVGGYEQVTLADGSVIQLNTDSEVRTLITPDKREIELVRGEALINATNDPRRPLMVRAANARARAGFASRGAAAFVVRVRPLLSVDFGVTDGSITVGTSYRLIDVALRREFSSESTLTAGDSATVRAEGVHLERVGLDELYRKLNWRAGLLTFRGETLTEVADEFNRYNRRQLLVTDPAIAGRRIGGAFQANDPDSFIASLEKHFDIHADEQTPTGSGETIIRLRGTQRR
jgi:transmembrane sensor